MSFQIKPFLMVQPYSISYMGKLVYDFKSSLVPIKGTKETKFKNHVRNNLNLTTHSLPLKYTSISKCGTGDFDFHSYYLLRRKKSSGLIPDNIPTLAEFLLERISPEMVDVLRRLVTLASAHYNVITDIPNIGGICFHKIYESNYNIWDMGYRDLVELNMFKLIYDKLNINLDKINKPSIILTLHNAELAYDISTLVKGKSIPITLLGK